MFCHSATRHLMHLSSPSSTVHASRRQAALLVAYMWVAYFLNYCDRQAVSAMFPSLRMDLHMSDEQLGWVGSLFLWVYALGCPIAGQLGDRFSKRLLVVLSLVVWSMVTLSTSFAATATMMLTLRAMMGISECLYMPTAIALTASAHPPSLRSRAIAMLTTAQVTGMVAGSWFGGWMADRGQWRGAFVVLGAVGLVYAVPYSLFLRKVAEPPAKLEEGMSVPVARLVKTPTFVLLCVVFPIFVFGLWLIYNWLPDFLHDKFHLNQSDAAFNATAFLQSASFIGLIGGGWLADALSRRFTAARLWLMVATLIVCAPCLYAIGWSATLNGTRAAAIAFGLFAGLMMGNIFPGAFEVVPTNARASAVGALNFCGGIMSGFAPLFGGLWRKSIGINGLLTLTGIVYAVAGVALLAGIKIWFPKDRQTVHN